MTLFNITSTLIAGLFLASCGFFGDGDSSDESDASKAQVDLNGAADGSESADETTRLKGAALLSRSFVDIIGPDADINVSDPDEHLFVAYKGNFGGNEGLNFGSTYANSLGGKNQMTSYFMALSYIAYNAGLRCNSRQFDESCDCFSPGTARSMLSRAIPWENFNDAKHDDLVAEFSALCNESYPDALAALLSSVAVAKRN